jgi:assimilatory nitrate reductase catalytic subunit
VNEDAATPPGWTFICELEEILPEGGVCALIGARQIALFRVGDAIHALDDLDPASGVHVLSRGIIADIRGERVVASPLYKHHYSLSTGRCLEDPAHSVATHPVRVTGGRVFVHLQPADRDSVRSTCPYCGVGCGVLARNEGGSFQISGDPQHPANRGQLCSKGQALAETLGTYGRLLHPEIHGRRVSWEEAVGHVSEGLARTLKEHGPESVAFYVSGQLLTEDYYVANKLMKGFIGAANIDTNSRLCMASAAAGHVRAFGGDLVPGCYEDLELADLIVLVGANTAWCHPVLLNRITRAREERPGVKLLVIDPRRTATAELADLHLPIAAGTDVVLFNGLLTYLWRHGCADARFIRLHTEGLDCALQTACACAPDVNAVAAACGVDAALVGEFYRLFAACERVVTAFSQGVNQSSAGTDKVSSIINCHLLTGRIGRAGMGPFSLTGQPNAMGGREVGGMSNLLAAHIPLGDARRGPLVQQFWNSPHLPTRPGLKAVELFEAVHAGRIKAIWIMATNPVVSLPQADRVREALERCELVVVSDTASSTDTTALAQVLLPAAAWGEKDGTVTNSERCISRQRAFLPPPGQARPDWWIVSEVARRMGFAAQFPYSSPGEIFDEHARLSTFHNEGSRVFDIGALAGLTPEQYDQLAPVQWPFRRGQQAVARLFNNGHFAHLDGKARFVPTPHRKPVNAPDEAFPLVLNTGRVRDQWHTMTRTGRAPSLSEHVPEPYVDMHPEDARLSGVGAGELARVSTRWGTLCARVHTSEHSARGSVFVPIHWSAQNAAKARVGALVNPIVDPVSGEPELKHTPAAVAPFPVAWYGFVMTRRQVATRGISWWTRVQGPGWLRYELAGLEPPADWRAWTLEALPLPRAAEWVDFGDAGIYRAAHVAHDRLVTYLCIAPGPDLPSRGWVASLFEKDRLDEADRDALLAGEPQDPSADGGALVCSCYRVGRETIREAITARALVTIGQVGAHLKAGTRCGSCLPEIRALLLLQSAPLPARRPSAASVPG